MKRTFHYVAKNYRVKIDLKMKIETNLDPSQYFLGKDESEDEMENYREKLFGWLIERFYSINIKLLKK